MSQFNGNFKEVQLADSTSGDTISMTLTSGASADDMAVSVDSGTGNAGPSGSGPYTMPVQSMVIFSKNWRILIEYSTPNAAGTSSVVTLTA